MSIVFSFSIMKGKKKAARINDGVFKPGLDPYKERGLGYNAFFVFNLAIVLINCLYFLE